MNAACRRGELPMSASPTFQLRAFGNPSIEREGGEPLTGRAAQRHRIALLTLIAMAPLARLSRDKLIAYLWPESDAERGRNLLKVSSYVLRTALGEDALLSEGDDLRLNTDVVRLDVAEFEAALGSADYARATALYAGPFLDGFFLSDAPEFDQWASGERDRLAACYAKALEALANEAEANAEFSTAAEWWKRRAAQDLYDSRVAARLMQALEASGNPAGALQHASIHQRLLQDELGMAASPEIAALADRLRREPAAAAPVPPPTESLSASPEQSTLEPASVAPTQPSTAATIERGPLRKPRRLVGRTALVAILAAVVVLAALWRFWPDRSQPDRSIAVLPFVDLSADSDREYFADGITEEIITHLSAVSSLKVISRTSAMRYKGSTKSLRQIADELGVAHVLEGSVRWEGDKVRITAQLIDAGADHHLWSRSYDRELVDVLGMQNEIAREVGRALEVELGEMTRALATRGTDNPEAYELYRRGRFLWSKRTREAHELATQYYRRAIEFDSTYADPYAGLADAYLTAYQMNLSSIPEAEVYSRLKWAAERALALDDQSADAHTSFAVALWWQRNWPGAERELRRAIELNPGHVTARSWYALLLSGMGRLEEAVQQSRRASELDPFAPLVLVNAAWLYYVARDYDASIELSRSALEINEVWAPAYANLSLAYAQKGMQEDAARAASKAVELGGPQISSFLAGLAYVHALAGRKEEAETFLERAKTEPWEGFSIARAYVALGKPDSAFAWLERSSWKWPHRAVRADAALDPLRSDVRFARLAERIDREMGLR